MSVHYLNIYLFLTISVALLGVILLFFTFSQLSPLPFHRSANDPFSSGGDSLQHVFNQSLAFSTTDIYSTVADSRHFATL